MEYEYGSAGSFRLNWEPHAGAAISRVVGVVHPSPARASPRPRATESLGGGAAPAPQKTPNRSGRRHEQDEAATDATSLRSRPACSRWAGLPLVLQSAESRPTGERGL